MTRATAYTLEVYIYISKSMVFEGCFTAGYIAEYVMTEYVG